MAQKNVNKTVLVILDGWGIRSELKGNAIAQAHSPFYDQLLKNNPMAQLEASSSFVGLPKGVMGNSEVGHMNIGAGKVVAQDLVRINTSFEENAFENIDSFQSMIAHHKNSGGKIHLLGLTSDGCVHSSQEHYLKIIHLLNAQGVDMDKVYFHAVLDGRDTSPQSALKYIAQLKQVIQQYGGHLATLCGRFFAMDRDQRWERTAQALKVYLDLGSNQKYSDPFQAIEASYEKGIFDEFFEPCQLIKNNGDFVGKIEHGDQVFCFNFRSDRMRQISQAFTNHKTRNTALKELELSSDQPSIASDKFFTMTRYSQKFLFPVMFSEQSIDMCLGKAVEENQLKQFRVAETEKYAHVTFFLNGGREDSYLGENRRLVPSPKVKTYDEVPAMNASKVTDYVCSAMDQREEHLIVVNYAQPDMIGHTGNFEAALKAVEATDQCLERIAAHAAQNQYHVFITADHGNIEQMLDSNEKIHTAHTVNPVPLILIDCEAGSSISLAQKGSLSNIAPTVLQAMGLEVPSQMTSKSLLKK